MGWRTSRLWRPPAQSSAGFANKLDFINTGGSYALNITGTTTITFDNPQNVLGVEAGEFTGGINGAFSHTGAAPLVFNAGKAGSSTLDFSNVDDPDIVTLGNGNNSVILGGGDDVYKAGTGDNTVTGGAGQDDMTVALDTVDSDTFVYNAATESAFSLPDIITGFTTGDILSLTGVAAFDAFNFAVVTSDAAVAGALATLEAASGGSDHVVYNSTTGHVYFDIDSSGTLNALAGQEDMEITLVGLPNLTAGQILT